MAETKALTIVETLQDDIVLLLNRLAVVTHVQILIVSLAKKVKSKMTPISENF